MPRAVSLSSTAAIRIALARTSAAGEADGAPLGTVPVPGSGSGEPSPVPVPGPGGGLSTGGWGGVCTGGWGCLDGPGRPPPGWAGEPGRGRPACEESDTSGEGDGEELGLGDALLPLWSASIRSALSIPARPCRPPATPGPATVPPSGSAAVPCRSAEREGAGFTSSSPTLMQPAQAATASEAATQPAIRPGTEGPERGDPDDSDGGGRGDGEEGERGEDDAEDAEDEEDGRIGGVRADNWRTNGTSGARYGSPRRGRGKVFHCSTAFWRRGHARTRSQVSGGTLSPSGGQAYTMAMCWK